MIKENNHSLNTAKNCRLATSQKVMFKMTPHEELLSTISAMLETARQQEWETFYTLEVTRKRVMEEIQQSSQQSINPNLLRTIIESNQQLETIASEQKEVAKATLLTLQKGKKANNLYLS